jgi:hypothetical protein
MLLTGVDDDPCRMAGSPQFLLVIAAILPQVIPSPVIATLNREACHAHQVNQSIRYAGHILRSLPALDRRVGDAGPASSGRHSARNEDD